MPSGYKARNPYSNTTTSNQTPTPTGVNVDFVDLDDKDRIINFNKNFVFVNETDIYPSYCYNYKRFSYLDFIFNYNQETVYFIFKNENQYDLRRNNVEIYHIYHKNISQKYEILEYTRGHYFTMGQDANFMKNPMWKIKENGKGRIIYKV